MNFDFNPPNQTRTREPRHRVRPALLWLLAGALVLAGIVTFSGEPVAPTEVRTAPPQLSAPEPAVPEIREHVIAGEIQPGDTITGLLGDYFTPQELHQLASSSRKVFPLSGICAGQPYKICLSAGAFDRFEYDIDRDDQLIIGVANEGFEVSRVPIDYEVKTALIDGTIDSSLFGAVTAAGESAELAISLADIFAWDIDFIRDIRKGDAFQVLVEKRFRDGQPAGYGRILAAEFVNQGERYSAFLFQDGDHRPAYYDRDGGSLRKAFLRAPLKFTRISSGYTLRRFHPITKTWKAHPAIDYAAPTGTPIHAIGDGTIIRIGRDRFNGNHIKLRHANGIESMYLHMNHFAKGMHKGKRIAQGQTIGYVGMTGLATGPHLCFRMYKNGASINPAKLKRAAGKPVSKKHLAQFRAVATRLTARLEGRQTVVELHADKGEQ